MTATIKSPPLTIRQASAPCDLGWFLVGVTDKGICFLALGDEPAELLASLVKRFPRARIVPTSEKISVNLEQIAAFLNGHEADLGMALDLHGTPFQLQVCQALATIPPGSTRSYRDLAEQIGRPGSVRAVANGCRVNPIAVAIPCHRVIRRDGSLGGYRWGVERKKQLLRREQTALTRQSDK